MNEKTSNGPSLNTRLACALHIAVYGKPYGIATARKLMHPRTDYEEHDVPIYAREVISGVLAALLKELPHQGLEQIETHLSDELSEVLGPHTRSDSSAAESHPPPEQGA